MAKRTHSFRRGRRPLLTRAQLQRKYRTSHVDRFRLLPGGCGGLWPPQESKKPSPSRRRGGRWPRMRPDGGGQSPRPDPLTASAEFCDIPHRFVRRLPDACGRLSGFRRTTVSTHILFLSAAAHDDTPMGRARRGGQGSDRGCGGRAPEESLSAQGVQGPSDPHPCARA